MCRRVGKALWSVKKRSFFPLFIDFTQKKAVVIGGGKIATRRIQTLLDFVGEITVIAPACTKEIEILYEKNEILYQQKPHLGTDMLIGIVKICEITLKMPAENFVFPPR